VLLLLSCRLSAEEVEAALASHTALTLCVIVLLLLLLLHAAVVLQAVSRGG
jgi:hypothetical protein